MKNADLSSVKTCGIYLRACSLEMPMVSIIRLYWKNTHLKLQPHVSKCYEWQLIHLWNNDYSFSSHLVNINHQWCIWWHCSLFYQYNTTLCHMWQSTCYFTYANTLHVRWMLILLENCMWEGLPHRSYINKTKIFTSSFIMNIASCQNNGSPRVHLMQTLNKWQKWFSWKEIICKFSHITHHNYQ